MRDADTDSARAGRWTAPTMNPMIVLLAALAVLIGGAAVSARAAPDLAGPGPWGLPAFRGRIDLFTFTPRGTIDGLILNDGTEVKTPPHLSQLILRATRRGDIVTVRGLRAAALPLVQAISIEDETSGQTVIDRGPGAWAPANGSVETLPAPTVQRVEGRIRLKLHGARGDLNGVLLDSGLVVRLPPPDALRFIQILAPDQHLIVDGVLRVSPLGAMIEASAIGASADRMTSVVSAPGVERRP
jgi:hypothetical protein